jgi:hypothetical protein
MTRGIVIPIAFALLAAACVRGGDQPIDHESTSSPPTTISTTTTVGRSTFPATTTSTRQVASAEEQLRLHSLPIDLPLIEDKICETTPVGNALADVVAQTYGKGPVYATLGSWDATVTLTSEDRFQGWYYVKVLWSVASEYTGPALIRGRQLDGEHVILFGPDEATPTGRQLVELIITPGSAPAGQSARFYPGTMLLPGPGCYGLQIDSLANGEPVRDVVVFQAVQP